jgi:phosphatidylinositol 3-kinase
MQVKEKFCLELSEEEAIRHFSELINESLGAIGPRIIDWTHGLLQNMRS